MATTDQLKYPVGKKVRVRNLPVDTQCKMESGTYKNNHRFGRDHAAYAGKIVTISEHYGKTMVYRIEEDKGKSFWFDTMFEPVGAVCCTSLL